MKLLVTTSKSLLLVTYSDKTNIKVLHEGYGLYYGITYSEDYIYVAARKRMLTSSENSENENGVLLVFNKELILKEEICCHDFPLRDMHQIQYYSGKIYITCSFDNMIAIYDLKTKNWSQWFPNESVKFKDVNHFNSIFVKDDSLYLLAHNFGDSMIYKFDTCNLQLVKQQIIIGKQAHNIWMNDGDLYTCSSGEESIKSTGGFVKVLSGFLRGITFSSELCFVGSSEKVERKDRDMTDGKIFVLNKSLEEIDSIILKKEGMVLDIKLLGVFDYSINKIFKLGDMK